MKSQMTDYLEKTTDKPWRKTDRLYLQFKTRAWVFPQFCVFTPDDYPRQPKAMCQFYLPAGDPKVWHQPRRFLLEYLNAKQRLAKQMPWVEFNLDKIPIIKGEGVLSPIPTMTVIVNYQVALTGRITLRKLS